MKTQLTRSDFYKLPYYDESEKNPMGDSGICKYTMVFMDELPSNYVVVRDPAGDGHHFFPVELID